MEIYEVFYQVILMHILM